jgi:hypothetical protein
MTDNPIPLECWNVVAVNELPEEYPADIELSDGPFGWKNTNTDTVLHLEFDEDSSEWIVAGSNSAVATADDIASAQSKAREYMGKHPRPSPMVG